MTEISKTAPVLVTGASGYIAGWIVKYLLEAGHTVHGTVRDPAKPKGLEHLKALSDAHPGQLKLFKADLLTPGAYDAAMQGCELVMHTASPFIITGFTDANQALVRPAVEGTRNVLEACNRVSSVKRVVLTSSVAGIFGDNADLKAVPGGVFTEEHWNTSSSVSHQPYSYSKVAAEREAWKIQKAQSRWDLVTINPALVLGPSLARSSASTSISTMKQLGNGTMRAGAPKLVMGVVDVRDVAQAHILAGYNPAAEGRHIVCAGERSLLQLGTVLRGKFPQYPFPRKETPTFLVWLVAPLARLQRSFVRQNVGLPLRIDNRRSREKLGLSYRPIDQTVVEHFQQMIDDGLMRRR
ncbi:diaminohydroxyphosphoribosylaminopyrimidine deaminase [Solimonas fluminis]|uniref:Diaminohydroxyphosphoribosylaminopyrimidine deaminase n=1 Tax=Solimonas fluminis TaxID=2086571 RepID=A0A2S5TEV6_9GAMM|nr:aldehyde reductase [Solimonas fluminis]PPE73523.1 diaminohydroxyphosphoribosylaminopyrimidine deaminase [Solimonas fluminis]